MQYTHLGKTGLKVSRLCLGTMNFGTATPEKEAFAIMDAALDAGINFFDCANMYGWSPFDGGVKGATEELLGRWFAQGGGRREKVVLTTKASNDMDDPNDGPNGPAGLSAYKIRRHLEASLRRLGTDHVELFFMHDYDPTSNWDELFGVFDNLTAAGKMYYAGASNFGARQLCYAQAAAKSRHELGLVCAQFKYNLVSRLPELELIPAAGELGMGEIVWSPLAGGLLSGSLKKKVAPGQRSMKYVGQLNETLDRQLQDYSGLCADLGMEESNTALAWLLTNPRITAPIIGPRTLRQFEDMVQVCETGLPEDAVKRLDEIFPGYREAPKGYMM